ncbi:alanine racemase [Roseibium sp.]|uniref:alanine racemase n=1 Tax=Roseibium sp. TaxID=1936156 RepID=UPI003A97D048
MQDPSLYPDDLYGGLLTVDRDAIAANWSYLKALLRPGAECAATIKADGYGTGAAGTGLRLWEEGCKTFFVALPNEGLALRSALPDARIFILDGLFPGVAATYADNRLIPVLGSIEEIDDWARFCRDCDERLPAAIHIDTGMNRLGVTTDEFAALMADGSRSTAFEIALLMTHLACGSTPEHPMNARQLEVFRAATDAHASIPRSMANSAGVFLGPDYHFDLARPGISLYGGKAIDAGLNPMAPIAMVEARIILVRDVRKGNAIGYGAAETAQRDMRVAIVAAGYADGLLRRAGSSNEHTGGFGWLSGHKVPLVGRVSMDMIAVDVTDVPEELAKRGCLVEMLGPNVAASDLAAYAETIDYEYLTGLGQRYRRRYQALPAPDKTSGSST